MTDWSGLIDEIRRENGMSKKKLCLSAGVQRSTYRRAVDGRGRLSIDQVERLAGVFGYELDVFCKQEMR